MITEGDLKKLICDRFLDSDYEFPLEPDTQLVEEGICDSLGLVRLAAEVEKRCDGVKIADQEITREQFGSIAAILALLDKKRPR